jgi:superfamily I DNA and/or RNA helicase/very-short-patch-repair endonuclease
METTLLNPDLIKYLIKKLKIGNLRGSHLNCLPGKSRNRFSLFELEKSYLGEPINFLKYICENSNFSLNINLPPIDEEHYEKISKELTSPKFKDYSEFNKERVILSRRLNNIAYDLKNEFQEYGTKSFGFGFPSLVISNPNQPDKVVVAPLLIWYLELKQDLSRSNNWIITKNEENPIVFNEVLFNYLKESHGVSFNEFKDLQDGILEDGKVDYDELTKIVSLFEKKINQGSNNALYDYQEIKIEDYQSKEILTEEVNKKRFMVINNGSFAFYRTFKESIIQDMENMLKNLGDLQAEENTSYQNDFFSAISTDPSQSMLLESLGSEKNILVQGPPGTGKSQSLTAIITNALKNQAKCLIVCEKKTAMEILHSNLKDLNLDHLAVMIDDPIKDRGSVVELAREKIDNPEPAFSPTHLESILDSHKTVYDSMRNNLENHHRLKNTPQLNYYTRQDLIGKFLKVDIDTSSLDQIDLSNFTFDSIEYGELTPIISQFNHVASFLKDDDPLFLISNEFIKTDYSTSKANLLKQVSSMNESLNYLYENSEKALEDLEIKFEDNLRNSADQIIKLVDSVIKHYKIFPKNVQKDLEHDNLEMNFAIRIMASISSASRKKLVFKKTSLISANKIKNILDKSGHFDTVDLIDLDKISIAELISKLKKIANDCDKEKIKTLVKKTKEKLTITDESPIDLPEIKELKDSYLRYNNILEESMFKKEELEIDPNILLKDLKVTCEFKLNLIKALMPRFDFIHEYYSMIKFIDGQDIKVQFLLNNLLSYPNEKYQEIFEHWFIANNLRNTDTKGILRSDNDIKVMLHTQNSIKNLYPELIKAYWNSVKFHTINKFRNNSISLKSLYNLRGANGRRRNSLRSIVAYDFEAFTNLFPVVLTNPSSASSIFPMKLGLFDVVIFDEASQLRIEDTFTSFIRGNVHIVSGDKHQMPPSSFFISDVDLADDEGLEAPDDIQALQKSLEKNNLYNLISSESLLEFAGQLDFKEVYLDIHYRSKHPDLIEFSNKAFYGSRLVPTPPISSDEIPIKFYEVNGVYHSEDRTNNIECEKVIDLIQAEYKSNPELSIGVATLNLNQRNLILDRISELSAKDQKFSEMINHLDQNGFFVKNLENIQGDERDVIIISTTFGLREDGSFTQNFGPLTKRGGYRLLNVIITRAKERLQIVTSIPQEKYSQYDRLLEKEGNDGKAIFYAYLSYANAVSAKDNDQKERVLKLISNKVDNNSFTNSNLDLTESPFEEEVYQRLLNFIPENKIHLQQKAGGFRLDIVVDTSDPKCKIAIECDGATYHRSEQDHYWDIFRQEYLENYGYVFHRIWSENWFEDAGSETRKLLAFIEGNNGFVKRQDAGVQTT